MSVDNPFAPFASAEEEVEAYDSLQISGPSLEEFAASVEGYLSDLEAASKHALTVGSVVSCATDR